ncbi:Xaa-His dipeptidase [Staphylococcus aureus]|nr:Xaa-His dipeptidase [Staphylococcus aureus]
MWKEKVQQYEDQIINDLKGLLAIESVRDDAKHQKTHQLVQVLVRH